jgi:transposase InsO family protein
LDFIGQIHPLSSKGHRFMLVATDYFTKWTEVVPLKNMIHTEIIEFITEHIIHRFGIPQTLTTDQGTSFVSSQVREFIESYKIKLLNSSPYYAQANGQAESSNKTLIKLIKKKIDDNLRRWHEVLSEALWAHRISRHYLIGGVLVDQDNHVVIHWCVSSHHVLRQHAVGPYLGPQSLYFIDQLLQAIEHILRCFIIKHDKSIELPLKHIYLHLSHGF